MIDDTRRPPRDDAEKPAASELALKLQRRPSPYDRVYFNGIPCPQGEVDIHHVSEVHSPRPRR